MPESRALVDELSSEGLAELHTHLGGSVDPAVMWTLAHEQGIALPVKDYWDFVELVTVDPRGRQGAPRARRHLQVDGADPVEPARRRALGARRHRRRLSHPEHHDARAPLQPDEAKPRRRARPRPHHHGRVARARPRAPRVSERARRPDPDDGPDLHAPSRTASSSRRRSATRTAASSASTSPDRGRTAAAIRTGSSRRSSSEARAGGLGVTIHVGEEGGRHGIEEIGEVVEHLRPERIGHGILAAKDDETMRGAARDRDRARDLPQLEPPHGRARRRGRARGDRAHLRRPRTSPSRSPPTAPR